MKKIILVSALLIYVSIFYSQNASNDILEIKAVIQTSYVEGIQNEGDVVKIEAGFHPDFHLLGISEDDNMWKLSIKDWKNKAVKKRKSGVFPLIGKDKVSVKFVTVDLTGNAAMVKLEYYKGDTLTFMDYISLYKFKSGWKIVSKIFNKF